MSGRFETAIDRYDERTNPRSEADPRHSPSAEQHEARLFRRIVIEGLIRIVDAIENAPGDLLKARERQ